MSFLADENIHIFYITVACLLCMGPISYGIIHWQIFSVDWQEMVYHTPPQGAIGTYMHRLYTQSEGTDKLVQLSQQKSKTQHNGRLIKPLFTTGHYFADQPSQMSIGAWARRNGITLSSHDPFAIPNAINGTILRQHAVESGSADASKKSGVTMTGRRTRSLGLARNK